MVSLHRPVILPSDAVQYRSAARVLQHQAVLLIQQYTVLQVCQPRVNAIFSGDTTPRPAAVSPGTVQTAHLQWSAEVRHFRPEKLNTFICSAAIKRCDCTAGQRLISAICAGSPEKCIRFEHHLAWEFSSHMRPPSGRAAPVTGDRIRMQVRPRSRSAWRRNTKRDRVRRPATATHLHRMQPVNVPARPG